MIELDPSPKEQVNAAVDYCAKVDQGARHRAVINVLKAIGVGLVAGLVYHALRAEPKPQRRLGRLLEDMEERLRGIGEPALRKASAFAAGHAHAVGDGVQCGEVRVERFLRNAGRRLREFWS